MQSTPKSWQGKFSQDPLKIPGTLVKMKENSVDLMESKNQEMLNKEFLLLKTDTCEEV